MTLLAFALTPEALADQLLATVVNFEQPRLERERVRVQEEAAAASAELQAIEDRILVALTTTEGSLLEDQAAVQVRRVRLGLGLRFGLGLRLRLGLRLG